MTGAIYVVSDAAGCAGATGWYATGGVWAAGCAGATGCLGFGIGAIAFLTLGEDCERGGPFGLGLIEGPAGGPERGGPPIPEGPECGGAAACGGPAFGGPAFGGVDGLPSKDGIEVGIGLLGACLCACG